VKSKRCRQKAEVSVQYLLLLLHQGKARSLRVGCPWWETVRASPLSTIFGHVVCCTIVRPESATPSGRRNFTRHIASGSHKYAGLIDILSTHPHRRPWPRSRRDHRHKPCNCWISIASTADRLWIKHAAHGGPHSRVGPRAISTTVAIRPARTMRSLVDIPTITVGGNPASSITSSSQPGQSAAPLPAYPNSPERSHCP